MKSSIVCLIIILFSFTQSVANLDSLVNLANRFQDKADKMDVYKAIYKKYKISKPDTVLYFLQQQIILGKKLQDHRNVGLAYFRIALLNRAKGNYDIAIQNYLNAARIFKSEKYYSLYANTLNNLGFISIAAGSFESALIFFDKVSTIHQFLGEQEFLIAVYLNIGYCHFNLHNFTNAEDYYKAALHLSISLNKPGYLYDSYNYLGELALETCQYQESIAHYQKALLHIGSLGVGQMTEAIIYNNIGGVHLKQGTFEMAESFFLKALKIKEGLLNEGNSIMITLAQLGDLEIRRGNRDKGLNYVQMGISMANRSIINKELVNAISILGRGYKMSVKKGLDIDDNKWVETNAIWEDQHTKLWELKRRLESNDIQKALYFKVALDKKEDQLLSAIKIKEIAFYVMYGIIVLLAIAILLIIKARRTFKKANTKFEEANALILEIGKMITDTTTIS